MTQWNQHVTNSQKCTQDSDTWCDLLPAQDVVESWVQIYLIFVDVLEQLFCSKHFCYANKLSDKYNVQFYILLFIMHLLSVINSYSDQELPVCVLFHMLLILKRKISNFETIFSADKQYW